MESVFDFLLTLRMNTRQLKIIPLVLCFATINSVAQTHKLPNKIRQDLARQIGNWQLVSFTQPDGKKYCQVITGDFDGNRQSDYAVYVHGSN
jgi:hypothetical protein